MDDALHRIFVSLELLCTKRTQLFFLLLLLLFDVIWNAARTQNLVCTPVSSSLRRVGPATAPLSVLMKLYL